MPPEKDEDPELKMRTLTSVPNDQVAQIKAMFEAEGAIVAVSDNGNGTSNVNATYPYPKV